MDFCGDSIVSGISVSKVQRFSDEPLVSFPSLIHSIVYPSFFKCHAPRKKLLLIERKMPMNAFAIQERESRQRRDSRVFDKSGSH